MACLGSGGWAALCLASLGLCTLWARQPTPLCKTSLVAAFRWKGGVFLRPTLPAACGALLGWQTRGPNMSGEQTMSDLDAKSGSACMDQTVTQPALQDNLQCVLYLKRWKRSIGGWLCVHCALFLQRRRPVSIMNDGNSHLCTQRS